MKKYFMTFSILLFTLLLVTGCGDKKLVCTVSEIDETVEAIVKFKDDEASTATFKMTFKADSKEEAEEGKKEVDAFIGSTYSAMNGVTYKSELKGTNVLVTITMEIAELDEDTRKEYLGDKSTYEEIKAGLEKNGYSCK